VRKRPLLRQNSPGRVSSRGVPAARAYLENLLASPLPPRPPCIATTKGGAGRRRWRGHCGSRRVDGVVGAVIALQGRFNDRLSRRGEAG
jgi:hypothetical protein